MFYRFFFLIAILVLCSPIPAVSQIDTIPPSVEWSRNYGASNSDIAFDFQATSDGGFIVVGSTEVEGINCNLFGDTSDLWILKLDHLGIMEWEKQFGGSQHDEAIGVEITKDNGYLILGSSASDDGDFVGAIGKNDFWLIKLSADGALEWSKPFGGSAEEKASDLISTIDGGFLLLGTSNSIDGDVEPAPISVNRDIWVLKINELGELLWQKRFDSDGVINNSSNFINEAGKVIQTSDQGFAISAAAYVDNGNGTSARKFWVIKLDESGNLLWDQKYGGNEHDVPHAILETLEKNLIVAGETRSFDGDIDDRENCPNIIVSPADCLDIWVIKLDSMGTLLAANSFGGSLSDVAFSIAANLDGFLVAGYSKSLDGDIGGNNIKAEDIWLIKLDEEADSLKISWTMNLGSSNRDRAYMVRELSSSEYVLVGFSEKADHDVTQQLGCRDLWVLKLSDDCQMGAPGKAILEGDSIFCSGDELLLGIKNTPPNGVNVWYHWYTPLDIVVTTEPQLVISNLTDSLDNGTYQLIVESDGCPSLFSDSFSIQVAPDIIQKNIAMTLCEGDVMVINGKTYDKDHPSGIDTFSSTHYPMCDSLVFIDLTFEIDISIFQNEIDPTLRDTEFYINQNGCDSLIIYIPNPSISPEVINPLLTPDGDVHNEWLIFEILDQYPENELVIFNRYGTKVFGASPYRNDWQGTNNNGPLPEGTYYYILSIEGLAPRKGHITLLR